MKKAFFIISGLVLCSQLSADFKETGYGARAAGMGNSFVALADDVYGIFYNPAGLVNVRFPELTGSYRKLYWGLDDLTDLGESVIGFASPIKSETINGELGTIGIGFLNFHAGGLYSENTIIISYGRSMEDLTGRKISLGINLKTLSNKYGSTPYTENSIDFLGNTYGRDPVFEDGYGKTVFGVDFGSYMKFADKYSAGLFFRNINEPDTGLKQESRLPLGIKAGVCYTDDSVNVLVDAERSGNDLMSSAGIEKWLFGKCFAARCGLRMGSRDLANVGLGGSYNGNGKFRVDYSFNLPIRGIKDTYGTHTMSVVIFFVNDAQEKQKINESAKAKKQAVEQEPVEYSEAVRHYRKSEYVSAYDGFTNIIGTNTPVEYQKLSGDYITRIKTRMTGILAAKTSIKQMHYASGYNFYVEKKYEECLNEWKKFLEKEPENKEIRQWAGFVESKVWEEKLARIDNLLKEAKRLYSNKAFKDANVKIEEILKIEPGHVEAAGLKEEILREEINLNLNREKKQSEREKTKIEEKKKINTEGKVQAMEYYTKGVMFYNNKNYSKAIEEWQRCLKIDARFLNAADYIKKANEELIKETMSKTSIESSGGKDIDNDKAKESYDRALAKYNQGYLKKSIEYLKEALKFNPDNKAAREMLQKVQSEYEQQTGAK